MTRRAYTTRSSAERARQWSAAASLLLVPALLFAADAVDVAAPDVHEAVDYRDVGGATEAELVASMKSVASADASGHRFAGDTHWQLRWNFHVDSAQGQCRVVSVGTGVDIRTTLLRWNPPLNAKPALVKRWNRFADALRKHESGHRDIAVAAAREVGERAAKVAPEADCATLKRNLEQAADAVVRDYRDKENSYDVTTMHGRAQGATFP